VAVAKEMSMVDRPIMAISSIFIMYPLIVSSFIG
jgi:hypothetical protein